MKYPIYLALGDSIITTVCGFEFHSKPVTTSITINNDQELLTLVDYLEEHELEMLRTVYNLEKDVK